MKEFSQEMFQTMDDYLLGRMSSVDQTKFETEMASDSNLKQEVDFQKDLVEQINNREALRIKSHLNNIPVTTTSPFLQTKWLVTYAVAGIIAAGAALYNVYTQFDNNPNEVAQTHRIDTEFTNYYEDNQSGNVENISAKNDGVETNEVINNDAENNMENLVAGNNQNPEDNNVNPMDVVAPGQDVNESEEDGFKANVETPEVPTTNTAETSENKLGNYDVKVDYKGKELLYYFENSKLFLKGVKSSYILHNIETISGVHEYYFEQNGKFYRLDQKKTESTPMVQITNQKLINDIQKKYSEK